MASLAEVLGFKSIRTAREERMTAESGSRARARTNAASVRGVGPGGLSLAAPDNSTLGDFNQNVLGNLLGPNNLNSEVLTNPLFIPGSDFKSEINEDGTASFDFTQIGGKQQDFDSLADFNKLSGDALLELVGGNAFNTANRSGQSTTFSPSLGTKQQNTGNSPNEAGKAKGNSPDSNNVAPDIMRLFDSASPEKQAQILELLNGT